MEPEALTARGTLRRQRIATGAGGHSSSGLGAVIYGGTGEQRFDRGNCMVGGSVWPREAPVVYCRIERVWGFGRGGGGADTKCFVEV